MNLQGGGSAGLYILFSKGLFEPPFCDLVQQMQTNDRKDEDDGEGHNDKGISVKGKPVISPQPGWLAGFWEARTLADRGCRPLYKVSSSCCCCRLRRVIQSIGRDQHQTKTPS